LLAAVIFASYTMMNEAALAFTPARQPKQRMDGKELRLDLAWQSPIASSPCSPAFEESMITLK